MQAPPPTQAGWQELFRSNSRSDSVMRWRVLRKHNEPLLVLPENSRAAATALTLYPAQTTKARMASGCLRLALNLKLPLPLERVEIPVAEDAPFSEFLAGQAGAKLFPPIAIFCGNPRTPGRRFIILVFGGQFEPVRIIKAGIGKHAMDLIERERRFLDAVPRNAVGIPKCFGAFTGENFSAFAMEFLEGKFPSVGDGVLLPEILSSWVQDSRKIALAETAPWRELTVACADRALLRRLSFLGSVSVPSVIWHGDFTPWNMKVDRRTKRCVVFDWERGQLNGVPAWDWFHYVLQTAVLVEKLSPAELCDRTESLLKASSFQNYLKRCAVSERGRELLLAYLLYNVEVLKPSEGGETFRALLKLLENSWTGN